MADVINLDDHRPKPASLDEMPRDQVEKAVLDCVDALMDDWSRAARANRLNDFIVASVSPHSRPGLSYLSDLQAIADLEARVGIALVVRGPGHPSMTSGWVAACYLTPTQCFDTPPMVTEQYARCFNVLLFMKLRRTLPQP